VTASFSLGHIREKIHLFKRQEATGKIENSTGWLLQAIKRNYANPEFAEAQKRQEAEEQKKTRQQRQREIQALKNRQEDLKNARDNALQQRCQALVKESPELIVPVVEALRAENTFFQKCYNPDLSPVENYRHTTGIWSYIDLGLEQHYPDRFTDVYAAHDPRLAELKDRLAVLEQA
jgi:hypothetical protein